MQKTSSSSTLLPQYRLNCNDRPELIITKPGTMHFTAITSLGLAFLMGTATALQVNWYSPFPYDITTRHKLSWWVPEMSNGS